MDETRRKLLDAAGEVFAEKGYDGATVRDICRKADANLASINYHFGDKQHLYVEAVKFAHSSRSQDVTWSTPIPAGAPEVRLREFIRRLTTEMLDTSTPTWHTELILREMARPTAACSDLVKNFIEPRCNVLLSIVQELIPKGAPGVPIHLAAFSIIGQCLLYRFHPIGRLLMGDAEFNALTVDSVADQITQFSLAGLKSQFVAWEKSEQPL